MRSLLDFGWLAGVDETVGAVIVVVLYGVLLLLILTRRRSRICGDDEPKAARRFGDLRVWIVALIAIQIGLHLWLL